MVLRERTIGRLGRGAPQTAQPITVPASVGGVNALDPLAAMPAIDCFYTYNLVPSEYGLRLRKGYREWATGCGTGTYTQVRSIIPFQGQNPNNDKMWAVTPDGIYNITTYNTTAPNKDVSFSNNGASSGYGVWTEMTLDSGVQVLFYADEENGLHQYTENVGWSVPAFTGPTVANIAYVTLFKQRLWVVEKNSGDAWYSPIDSIAGDMQKFTFGSKFTFGGELVGLWPWTIDGGAGMDDLLVAVSRGGDCIVYQGADPSLGDFGSVGNWYIGEMPKSRRVVEKYGGEFYILSTFGIVTLRDLLQGVAAGDSRGSPSAKVNRPLRAAVIAEQDDPSWALKVFPPDGLLQIIEPYSTGSSAVQYTQNLLTKAWGFWRGVPSRCTEVWNSDYFIGSDDGIVYQYFGQLDNTQLDGTAGTAIDFSVLTSFQGYNSHGTNKQAGMIRVVGVTSGEVSYRVKAVYDYDINAEAGSPASAPLTTSPVWDSAVWDAAVWDSPLTGDSKLFGATGIGRTFAIAMKGSANERITVVAWDVSMIGGGFL